MKNITLLIVLFISSFACKTNSIHLKKIEANQVAIDSSLVDDSIITSVVAPYKNKLESKMNTVLCYAPNDLSRNRNQPETAIGNFIADLCFTRGNAVFNKETGKNIDFVLLNAGGIRSGIGKGAVTTKSAYEVMPFENNMVVTELTYEKTLKLFNYLAKSGMAHPISKDLRVQYKNNKVESIKLHNKDLSDRNYYVLTSDYLQRGGDRMNFFKNPVSLTELHYKIRTAILDELSEIDTIRAKKDGRVKWINE